MLKARKADTGVFLRANVESAQSFLMALRTMLDDGKIVFMPYGVKSDVSTELPMPVGWKDRDGLYLQPRIFRDAAERLSPGLLNEISSIHTHRSLERMGLIVKRNPGRYTCAIRQGAETAHVLWLKRCALDLINPVEREVEDAPSEIGDIPRFRYPEEWFRAVERIVRNEKDESPDAESLEMEFHKIADVSQWLKYLKPRGVKVQSVVIRLQKEAL